MDPDPDRKDGDNSEFPFRSPSSALCQPVCGYTSSTVRRIWILFWTPFAIQSPQKEWSPRLKEVEQEACFFMFFFLISYFSEMKARLCTTTSSRGPCETPLPHGCLVHFRRVRQVVPIAGSTIDRQR